MPCRICAITWLNIIWYQAFPLFFHSLLSQKLEQIVTDEIINKNVEKISEIFSRISIESISLWMHCNQSINREGGRQNGIRINWKMEWNTRQTKRAHTHTQSITYSLPVGRNLNQINNIFGSRRLSLQANIKSALEIAYSTLRWTNDIGVWPLKALVFHHRTLGP